MALIARLKIAGQPTLDQEQTHAIFENTLRLVEEHEWQLRAKVPARALCANNRSKNNRNNSIDTEKPDRSCIA